MPGLIPEYEQRTRTPNPTPLERVRAPDVRNPVAGAFVELAGGVAQFAVNRSNARKDAEQREAYRAAETNVSAHAGWTADALRELETAPAEEVEERAEKIRREASTAWDGYRRAAGNHEPVLRFLETAREEQRQALEANLARVQAAAHGGLVVEKMDTAISDRSKAVESDPTSFQQNLDQIAFTIGQSLVDQRAQAAMRGQARASLAFAAARGQAKANPRSVLDRLAANDDADPVLVSLGLEGRQRIEQFAKAQLVDQTAAGIVSQYRRSASAGVAALAGLDSSGIAPELLDNIRAAVGTQVSQLRMQRRQERVQEIVGLEQAIATDTAGRRGAMLADSLYESGAFTPDEYANARAQIAAGDLRRQKSLATGAAFAEAFTSGLPLDPKDATHREGLDNLFVNSLKGDQKGSPSFRAAALALANRTRMLPDTALAWTRQAMRSPNDSVAANAAQFYGSVAVSAPDAVSGFDDATKSFATMVNGMIEAGTPPAEAVKVARANVFEVPPAVAENRRKAWSTGKAALVNESAKKLDNFIDRDFDAGLFASQPDATDPRVARAAGSLQLLPDFNAQTERYFVRSGDIEAARNLAWNDLKRVYGPSEINGTKTMFAFPPERFGVTRADVQRDVAAFLKATPQADGSTPEDVVLVPDRETLRQVGDALTGDDVRPSYLLLGKSGEPLLNAEGVPQRFTIPGGEELTKRIRDAQAKVIANAKAERDKIQRGLELARQKSAMH